MARMNKNMIWPSGWPHRDPAATNATPAPFSMISIDIRMKIRLRRIRSPANPSANKTPARMSACPIGMPVIASLCFLGYGAAEVVSSHQGAHQQHRSKFHPDQIGPVQRDSYLLRFQHARFGSRQGGELGAYDQIHNF